LFYISFIEVSAAVSNPRPRNLYPGLDLSNPWRYIARRNRFSTMPRALYGSAWGVGSTLAAALALIALRSHLSIATIGLILVVPVVVGVVAGGVVAGAVSVAAGFFTYDFAFIPPYYTLTVRAGQNWVALAVYAVVMLMVAQVVSRLQDARTEAQRREDVARRLLELTEMLVTDRTQEELLQNITDTVRAVFGATGVALILPCGDELEVAAVAGDVPTESDLRELRPESGVPVAVGPERGDGDPGLRAVALIAGGRPVGILALHGMAAGPDAELLRTFVNHAALALERGQLRNQALQSQVLEETDRMRRALLGAVSHDLRTPLTTMKVASSSLIESEQDLDPAGRRELYGLIDTQADRLNRLVTGLLDMNRYQAGALELRLVKATVAELIRDAVAALRPSMPDRDISVELATNVPDVRVDRLLIGQVLVNLIDNADRHAPPSTPIAISSSVQADGKVRLSVTDQGPGVPQPDQQAVFESFFRSDSGGRAGLGLWISRTFVEAHEQQIWVDGGGSGGARFSFTLSAA
jgi:two-component system sensor histidine kinase KdpD